MPNVLMVFTNREPDRKELSQERWIILKISKDSTELSGITDVSSGEKKSDITDVSSGEKKRKKMVNEDSDEGGWQTDEDY